MRKLKIALAQSFSKRGDIDTNMQRHQQFIERAAEYQTQLIVFPELSLTGYEPDLAEKLAFTPEDERLNQLQGLAKQKQMIMVVGAPVYSDTGLHIGAFIIYPNQSISLHTKQYLHAGEDQYFTPNFDFNSCISLEGETISLAICADISRETHAKNAAESGCSLYLASVLITENGYQTDAALLQKYARKYSMSVLMVNYAGESGGFQSAGRSAVWTKDGSLAGELEGTEEALLVVTKKDREWIAEAIQM